jgi:hypothetical protein
MAENSEPIERLEMRVAWVGVEDMPIVFANQLIGQLDDRGEAIITFGQASPPILIGSPEEQKQQAAAIPFVQVRPVLRLGVSHSRLREFVGVLSQTLENQTRLFEQQEGGAS